jgi:putative adenylate-forming enzyme
MSVAAPGGFSMIERLLILWHFIATRWLPAPRDREKRLQRFLAEAPRFAEVMNKSLFLEHFTTLNRHGITLEQATAVALRAERERDFKPELPGGVTAGLSSGTSGARQVFLVGRADRCRWAGQMLARMLSTASLLQIWNFFAPPLRIAFFLRASSNLYTTLNSLRVKFEYFDLTQPLSELVTRLETYRPQVLVAPATVLAELARCARVRPKQVISVAEVLDAKDGAAIEKAFGVPVAQIYQAAEGFLGCTCSQGRMHLNEESLHIEPEWLDEAHERFHPLITDFSRQTQWFVRHRLDDILRLDPTPCPCGRQTMTLKQIEGRAEEVLWLRNALGGLTPVFPDVLRQALYTQPVERYRIEQHCLRWQVQLMKGDEKAVQAALEALIDGLKLQRPTFDFQPWTDQPPSEKQKRIRCITKPT